MPLLAEAPSQVRKSPVQGKPTERERLPAVHLTGVRSRTKELRKKATQLNWAKDLNRVPREMIQKDFKMCPSSLEKFTLKQLRDFTLALDRMAKIKKTEADRGCGGTRGFIHSSHCWLDCKLVQPLWKPV